MKLTLSIGRLLLRIRVKPLVGGCRLQTGICLGSTLFAICYCTLIVIYLLISFFGYLSFYSLPIQFFFLDMSFEKGKNLLICSSIRIDE